MSTIKSSSEHLTLNADGSGKDINLQANGSTKVTVKSDGNVGIGTSSPTALTHIQGDFEAKYALKLQSTKGTGRVFGWRGHGVNGEIIAFYDITSNHEVQSYDGNSEIYKIFTGGSERMRIQSGGGISFNGDTAAANALDDYEEGTWTPLGTNGVSITSIPYASYTKIGRVVYWAFHINVGSGTTNSLQIGGLPYQSDNHYAMQSNINSSVSNATINNPHFRITPNGTVLFALKNNDTTITGTTMVGHIIASGTYMAP